MSVIVSLAAHPVSVELTEPFGIATGAQERADNVFVELELDDGSVGLGEAAPFPAVNDETQAQALDALARIRSACIGLDAARWREVAEVLTPWRTVSPSACCAVESAVLDAWCRRIGVSLWSFFGGRERTLTSDITIPTGSEDGSAIIEHARQATARAATAGYRTLKLKVGALDLDADTRRIREILRTAPDVDLILDANAGLDAKDAITLCRLLGEAKDRVVAFEQPARTDDLDGLREVEQTTGTRVIADESARSPADVARIIAKRACGAINIKLTKTGIAPSLDILGAARCAGLDLMIGGMVETTLCMSVSACLAAGVGGFRFVDLDTPLFMKGEPVRGGFVRHGPVLDVSRIRAGHGVTKSNP